MEAKQISSSGPDVQIIPSDHAAIQSRQSYQQPVYAICHHSGAYLTKEEARPAWYNIPPFREQHDFPGLPDLNKDFRGAAHARKYQHYQWSCIGMLGAAMVCLALATAVIVWYTGSFSPQSRLGLIMPSYQNWLWVRIIVGFYLIGLILIWSRDAIYHAFVSTSTPPATDDFPLLNCDYTVGGYEHYTINLGNTSATTPDMLASSQSCSIAIEIRGDEQIIADYQRFCQRYPKAGTHFFAGIIALENTGAVCLSEGPEHYSELDHRIILSGRVPEALGDPTYKPDAKPICKIEVPYTTDALVLGIPSEQRALTLALGTALDWHFPLVMQPILNERDSYYLKLRFFWNGDQSVSCLLESCTINLSVIDLDVVQVDRGRYDAVTRTVTWRNLNLQALRFDEPLNLSLGVRFSQPLLKQPHKLSGRYRCAINSLLSGVRIQPEHIWDARGLPLSESKEHPPLIETESIIEGDLVIDIQRLSQEHEYILATQLIGQVLLDGNTVDEVLQALVNECEIGLRTVDHEAPREALEGELQDKLQYWDIWGRRYREDVLDAIDVHLVLRGYEPEGFKRMRSVQAESQRSALTEINLYVRCLHDPRNTDICQRAQRLSQEIVQTILHKLPKLYEVKPEIVSNAKA